MTALPDQLTIRPAQADDLAHVAEIFNAGVVGRIATFQTTEPERPS